MAKLTPAEKQRRYRERKGVTKVTGNAPESNAKAEENVTLPLEGNESPTVTGVSEPKTGVGIPKHGGNTSIAFENTLLEDLPMVATTDKTIKYTSIRPGFVPAVKIPASNPTSNPTFPDLPDDEVCGCNSDIGWSDILAMPLERIDLAYKTWKAIGNDVSFLLRLRRSAGYYRRVG